MEIIVITVLTIAVSIYIAYPFFTDPGDNANPVQGGSNAEIKRKILNLKSEKDTLISEIRDIEFDYKLGKISEEDYQELTNKYKLAAAGLIEEIRRLESAAKQDN